MSAQAAGVEAPGDWKKEFLALLRSKAAVYSAAALAGVVALRLGANWIANRRVVVPAPSVRVVHPVQRPLDKALSLPANVEAIEESSLYAHVSGYLKKIYVDEGDHVKAGELLAEIDAPDIVQEYNRAKADNDLQQETLKRYKQLIKNQVISQQEFDTIEAQAEEANARLDNAAANMDYTRIRAPFSGSIARRYVYPGDLISEATKGGNQSPIFLLVNENRLRVSINVPESEIESIHIGKPVDIKVDALPGETFHGSVSRVDALLDEATKTQRVLIDIDNPDLKLRAGMFASVVLHTQHVDDALTVPREAVLGTADRPYVWTVVQGHVKQTPVKTGLSDQDSMQIVGGLSAGDTVAMPGSLALTDGAQVRPVAVDGGAAAQPAAPAKP